MEQIGRRIRRLRHEKNLSQAEVAEKLGISMPAFSKMETGITDMSLSRIEQIAEFFEVDIVELVSPRVTDPSVEIQLRKELDECKTQIIDLQAKLIDAYSER